MNRTAREPLIFVDLETTGANFANDRIIEVGVVIVDADGVSEWSSLVNPGVPVSSFITGLTGINTAMVANAPRFEEIAGEVLNKLRGRLFIAHNARFDYSFLKHEFHRLGISFRSPQLCTVKLSRKLFPEHHRHSLDALLTRYTLQIAPGDRHRALGDARVLWALWQRWHALLPGATIEATIAAIVGRPELPAHLDAALLDDLPEAPGAYALYNAAGEPLLVKRGTNLRQHLLAHFVPAKHDTALVRNTVRVDWRETAGELGARLAEMDLTARTSSAELCSWQVTPAGDFRPQLVAAHDVDFARAPDLFGLYMNRREALHALTKLAEAHRLCPTHLGLNGKAGEPCLAYRQRLCRGVCAGKEALSVHGARLAAALAKFKLKPWPYAGPIALVERDEFGTREDYHVFDAWHYLGRVQDEAALETLLENRDDAERAFEPEIYRLVAKFLHAGKVRVLALPRRN